MSLLKLSRLQPLARCGFSGWILTLSGVSHAELSQDWVQNQFYAGIRHFRTSPATPAAHVIQSDASVFAHLDSFERRHVGPSGEKESQAMLKAIGLTSMDELIRKAIPNSILTKNTLDASLGKAMTESEFLLHVKQVASKNQTFKTYIGMGYNNTITPPVILRNILESPGWFTQYTPYQPEISQGRLESLLNFQTMVSDLTGLPVANASLLDEGTAAAEAMQLCFSSFNKQRKVFFVDRSTHPQTIAVVQSRAEPLGIKIVVDDWNAFDIETHKDSLMGVLIQYPNTFGEVNDFRNFVKEVQACKAKVACSADLLALTILTPPGEWGADIVFGNSQRFGIPFGFGGPHAAFFAVKSEFQRKIPGRLIGVSKDVNGKKGLRLALQTREQHIRREKATSNICTAQALLANMSAMYAVYHGPKGLRDIAIRVHNLTRIFAAAVEELGYKIRTKHYFDTVLIELNMDALELHAKAERARINLRKVDNKHVAVSLDETTTKDDLEQLLRVFATAASPTRNKHDNVSVPDINFIAKKLGLNNETKPKVPSDLVRNTPYLTHPVFNKYHSETEMLRYIYHLQSKDLSLAQAMIPLGSCTMKLNATTEMIPITWKEFADVHPFVPEEQSRGYKQMLKELEYALEQVTGFDAISLQPNSGAQGEYAGLRVIRAYHHSRGESHRDVCLIPVSAHGTNPASAAMAGMSVVVVKCMPDGILDMSDFKSKVKQYRDRLSAIMITYPSTYGVFDEGIREICEIVHDAGGQVYMDGANLNAQIGLTKPAEIGADVCHMNLHKTFCIPHGGGGPGMGPIGVKAHLAPFLPGHPMVKTGGDNAIGPVSAAPFGSASILPISYAYIKMMGGAGLRRATEKALLNANYLMKRLEAHYKILFTNKNKMCAHEFIVDCRPFAAVGIEAVDIAKRLHDYSFHSPTMSFPVANTLMIEPTESESLAELDRFVDAMTSIRKEITKVEQGVWPKDNNPLVNAPHPVHVLLSEKWDRPYTREEAAYPVKSLRERKFWPTIGRVDDTYGDRNLICSCPPIEDYEAPQ